MTPAEKAKKKADDEAKKQAAKEKEERENPTVDENGEHIMTVAESKAQAAELQNMLVAGEQAVEEKIALQQQELANAPPVPAQPDPADDGHEETVEEVKAKMAAAQKAMDEGIAQSDTRAQKMAEEQANMPNFGALANMHSSLANMSNMRKKKQVNDLAAKLGVDPQESDYKLSGQKLSNTLIARAKEAGQTDEQI